MKKNGELMASIGFNPPKVLTSGSDDGYPRISPDGSQVLFERRLPDEPSGITAFELWVVDIDGNNARPLVTPDVLPKETGILMDSTEPVLLFRLPGQIEWLNGSSTIAFNTYLGVGYGTRLYNDLWLADTQTGRIAELLPEGQGGSFAFSPDGNKLLIADAETVSIMNADGSSRRKLVKFPFVNTASEYEFIPMPVWAPDSSYGLAAISGPEIFGEDEEPFMNIWRLPATGDAEELLTLYGFNLYEAMSGNLFSPDGKHIAYAAGDFPDGEVHIATLDGNIISSFDFAYTFYGWSTDGRMLILYADTPFLAGVGMPQQEMDMHEEVEAWSAAYKWVGPHTYVGLDFSYFLEDSILWITEIGGASRIIDYDVNSFDAIMIN